MDQTIWGILGIAETKDEAAIKQAYHKKLVLVNPEDDAEGFMKLREAYEQAIRLINNPVDVSNEKKKDDIDLWMDRVACVYFSMKSRIDEECWKELFQDPICIRIDTNLEAGIRLLEYIKEHYYLPHKIWNLIDHEFHISEEKEELYERFPRNFIDYIVYQTLHEGFLDYTLFVYVEGEDADEYITTYFHLKEEIDAEQLEASMKLFEKLECYKSYHPYKDVEKIRYYLLTDAVNEAANLSNSLISRHPKDFYIRCIHAKVLCYEGNLDESCNNYQELLQEFPDYYLAKIGLLESLYKKEELVAAQDMAMDILNTYSNDEVTLSYYNKINEKLIQKYQEMLRDKEDNKVKLELAWCFYQNNKYEESINLLRSLPEEIHSEYDYINLHGRVYLSNNQFDVALDKLKVWREAILKTEKDDSIQTKKRYERLGYANYAIGLCYSELEKYEEAVPYYQESIEVETNVNQKLSSMERLAYSYLKLNRLEECIGQCDKILEISCGYYLAYIHRQKAYFMLERDQEVINDYHKATEIFPGYISPYLFAMKAFLRHGQLEDAKAVAECAQKCNLDSCELKLLNIQTARRMAESDQDRENVLKDCLNLKEESMTTVNDIEDPDSVDYELTLIYAGLKRYDKALQIIDSIIHKKPDDDFYLYIKGKILEDTDNYEDAIKIFNRLLVTNRQSEKILYEIGFCHQMLGTQHMALEYYLKTTQINPRYSDVNDRIVDIYRNIYNNTHNREYYEKALPYANMQIEIAQNSYNYICRGLLYMDAYEFDKGIADFYKALEYDPENVAAYNNAGYTYLLMRKMDKSIEELQKATKMISIDKYNLPYANLGRAYRITQNYDEALKCYLELHKSYPDIINYVKYLAEIYKCKQDMKQSAEWMKKLNGVSGYSKARYYDDLADIFFFLGNEKQAAKYYGSAIILNTANSTAYLKYAEFLMATGKLGSSATIVKKTLQFAITTDVSYIETCRRAAMVYFSIHLAYKKKISLGRKPGKCEEKARQLGIQALQAMGRFFNNESEYYSYGGLRAERLVALASIYLSMGDVEKTKYYINLALESSPCIHCNFMRCVHAYELYGMLYESWYQLEKAMEYYNTIIDFDPGNMLYRKRLDNVRLKLNDKNRRM